MKGGALLKGFFLGVLLGAAFVAVVHVTPAPYRRQLVALFLAFTAYVYGGALLNQSAPGRVVALELVVAALVFGMAGLPPPPSAVLCIGRQRRPAIA